MRIDRTDPADLDLDTADAIAAISRASNAADGIGISSPSGPARLKMYQHASDGTPFAGVWLATDDGRLLGYASAALPQRDNTGTANLSGAVAPEARRAGVGRALVDAVAEHAASTGRTTVYSGALEGTGSQKAMDALGFEQLHTTRSTGSTCTPHRSAAGSSCTTWPHRLRRTTSWSALSGPPPTTGWRRWRRCSTRSTTRR